MQSLRFQECLLQPPFMGRDDDLFEQFDFLSTLGTGALKQAQLNAAIKQLICPERARLFFVCLCEFDQAALFPS